MTTAAKHGLKLGKATMTVRVKIEIDWRTAIKMMLIGRYPAAIIARAVADRVRAEGKR